MGFSLKNLKKTPLPVIVTIAHVIALIPIVACSSKIVNKPREVKVRVNLTSGELMTAPEVGEPEIKVGGPPAPEPPAPEPPAPEPPKPQPPKPQPPKPDVAQQQRQKKLAEERRRKKLLRERQKKIAERRKEQQRREAIAKRQKQLNEKRRREKAAEEKRRRTEAVRQRQRELEQRRRQASGIHKSTPWTPPGNVPAGNRNRGQRQGPMQKNPKIGGESRAEDRYFAGLPDFFKSRWSVPPGILAGEDSSVQVQLTVAADGRLLAWRLVKPSPSQAVNDSVRLMFSQLRQIPAPPNGAIKFQIKLNADML